MANKYKIKNITAEEILDSRGNPTIKVRVSAGAGFGEFSVPSGASTGTHEAAEKRDSDKNRFRGLGVKKAVASVNGEIRKHLIGMDIRNQKEIDYLLIKLDGTPAKKKLGANAILGTSIACAKAAAASSGMQTWEYLAGILKTKPKKPYLYLNLINAGKHASSRLAFQEYMIVPLVEKTEESLVIADKIRNELRNRIIKKYGPFSANFGDEGGFVIQAEKVSEPLEILTEIIRKMKLQSKVGLAIDSAASSFYKNGKYSVDGKTMTADELLKLYHNLIRKFPIISIEDPFHEDDFESFGKLLSSEPVIKVIGDDLTVTDPDRLMQAVAQKSINGIIIKPNQIGTLSETLETMRLADSCRVACVVSHRSGETNDDFIADLAYAFGSFGLKAGAPNRGERVAKYNRLMEITDKNKKRKIKMQNDSAISFLRSCIEPDLKMNLETDSIIGC